MLKTQTQTQAQSGSKTTWQPNTLSYNIYEQLQKIQKTGYQSSPRGLSVRELEMAQMVIDPRFAIADFAERPFNWKYFIGEIAWYLTRDCNIEWINHFSSFWQKLSESGCVNSNYGAILFGEQLQWAKDSLLRDQQTRQAISFVNQPRYQYPGNLDFVCTMYLNFWIREDLLHMKVQMRSNDIFYGLTYDAPFFATIMQTMWLWLQDKYPHLGLGKYYHCVDNLHYYERHFELADSITRADSPVLNPPFFLLKEPLFYVNNGHYVLSNSGKSFLQEVSTFVHGEVSFGQEESRNIANKYFYIQ